MWNWRRPEFPCCATLAAANPQPLLSRRDGAGIKRVAPPWGPGARLLRTALGLPFTKRVTARLLQGERSLAPARSRSTAALLSAHPSKGNLWNTKGRPNSTSPRPAVTPRASTARSCASSNAPADQPKRARGDQSEAGHDGGDTRIRDRATVRRHASGLSARYTSQRGYFESRLTRPSAGPPLANAGPRLRLLRRERPFHFSPVLSLNSIAVVRANKTAVFPAPRIDARSIWNRLMLF